MMKLSLALLIGLFFIKSGYCQQKEPLTLFDFEPGSPSTKITLTDAKAKILSEYGNHTLAVILLHHDKHPSVQFNFPELDLSDYTGIAMDIKNLGTKTIAIEAQCFNENIQSVSLKDGAKFYYRSMIILKPGEMDSLLITFSRSTETLPPYISKYLTGMFGLPGGFVRRKENIDLKRIANITVFKQKSSFNDNFTIDNIRAVGKYNLPDETALKNGFFPFVDRFGQYVHSTWTNKTNNDGDIRKQKIEEDSDLVAHPGPTGWDKYGGWQNGPTLRATGFFRVEKYKNKWWFVDPVGKLFWSQGINIIATSQRAPTQGRENYFEKIPPNGDFYQANLRIKYGADIRGSLVDTVSKFVLKRLRSWGINTIADHSDPYLYTAFKKAPYTIEVRSGISNPISDTLNESTFRKLFDSKLISPDVVTAAKDPWCMGFFVDNEIAWPEHNTKQGINTYFKVVKEELAKYAPGKLYLGSRINSPNFNRIAFEACAKYCDVISINHYDYNVSDFKETRGWDKPIIVGEFHFGALDRGLLHPGLRAVSNQKQRGRVYQHFIDQAAENPLFVGVHWFQYVDQIVSGRNDGENYQIGFVDICDRPYTEMVSASRKISTYLYPRRLNN